jgi:hypothetical protein
MLIALVCTTVGYGYGQNNDSGDFSNKVNFGVKIGFNYSNVYDTEGEDFIADPKLGFATGIFIAIPLIDGLGIQPEVLFSQKGYKAKGNLLGSNYEITHTSNYIDVPLLIAIKPVEVFTILAGPQYSFLLSQKNKFKNGTTNIEQGNEFDNEGLRKNTLCFTGGFDINLNQLVISGRVGWDLLKNNTDGSRTTPRYKNTWYQVTLGRRF